MRARGVAVQGALAAVALLAAYLTWQREPEGAAGDVVVLDVARRALERVAYEDEARGAELFREADGSLWVRLTEKPPRPPPAPDAGVPASDAGAGDAGPRAVASRDGGVADAGTAVAAAAPLPPPPPPRVLRAAPNAEEAFARFAPLRAARALGTPEAPKLAELGLVPATRSLVVTHAGGREAFEVASASSGWASPYVRRGADGRVFLLGPGVLTDLETAQARLVDRRMHTLELAQVERVEVEAGGRRALFVARPAPAGTGGPALTLAPAGQDAPDAFATQWADRVQRLYPQELLGRGEVPPGGEPQVAFRVTWRRGDAALETVTVARGAGGAVWARSGHTAGWVKLAPQAETLVGEAARVVGAAAP